MNPAQRIHWLGAGLLASAASDLAPSCRARLEEYIAGNERRVRQLAAFVTKAMAGDRPFIDPDRAPGCSGGTSFCSG